MIRLRMLLLLVLLLNGAFWPGLSRADQLDDAAIVAIYNQVNSFDIETALIGRAKGSSPDVNELATMVWRDHTAVRKAAHRLAVENGFTPTLPPSRHSAAGEHYEAITKLKEAEGPAFDKAYLLHEIAFHEAAIKAIKQVLLPSAKNARLKAHFEQVLPAFEHHLSETIRVAKKLRYAK